MSMPGLGVMINQLAETGDSRIALQESLGKEIKEISMSDSSLLFTFTDNSKIKIYDDGQSCCEHRYMNTDDNIQDYVGAKFNNADVQDGPNSIEDYNETECQFLIITTDKGSFTIKNYNEHNGYYGGFYMKVEKLK